ncbi:MAG: hypothetical protein ABH854_02185 [Candidatus Diapherotrites archaeon]|nr:hypothetical protein [Candidatus Micrarchaeota archaeon]MBU1939601.1 hypothetical protein [Candidatus Micrarchaeota archaeon]
MKKRIKEILGNKYIGIAAILISLAFLFLIATGPKLAHFSAEEGSYLTHNVLSELQNVDGTPIKVNPAIKTQWINGKQLRIKTSVNLECGEEITGGNFEIRGDTIILKYDKSITCFGHCHCMDNGAGLTYVLTDLEEKDYEFQIEGGMNPVSFIAYLLWAALYLVVEIINGIVYLALYLLAELIKFLTGQN